MKKFTNSFLNQLWVSFTNTYYIYLKTQSLYHSFIMKWMNKPNERFHQLIKDEFRLLEKKYILMNEEHFVFSFCRWYEDFI